MHSTVASSDVTIGYHMHAAEVSGSTSQLIDTVVALDAAGVDYLILPDMTPSHRGRTYPYAPLVTAAFLAAHTSRIGLVVTAATSYSDPYTLARQIASLDHASAGRAGWYVHNLYDPVTTANHPNTLSDNAQIRDARAEEFIPLVRSLWDSWETDALLHDKRTGEFIDESKVHTVDHVGRGFKVRGPLNVARPPQGHPLIIARSNDHPLVGNADIHISSSPLSDGIYASSPFVYRDEDEDRYRNEHVRGPQNGNAIAVLEGTPTSIAARLRHPHILLTFTEITQMALFTDQVLPLLKDSKSDQKTLREKFNLPVVTDRFAHKIGGHNAG